MCPKSIHSKISYGFDNLINTHYVWRGGHSLLAGELDTVFFKLNSFVVRAGSIARRIFYEYFQNTAESGSGLIRCR